MSDQTTLLANGKCLNVSDGYLDVDEISTRWSVDIDVVAIHGLHSTAQLTWASKGDEESRSWLTKRIFSELPSRWDRSRLFCYHYTDDQTSPHAISRPGQLVYHVTRLLEQLVENRKEDPTRPLIFVAEDVGGLMVKKALLLAASHQERFGSIVQSTRCLIFFGCPHRFLNKSEREDGVARLLFNGSRSQSNVPNRIETLSNAFHEFNSHFLNSTLALSLTIVNLYSGVEDLKIQIFDHFTCSLNIPPLSFEIQIESREPYATLARDPGNNEFTKPIWSNLGLAPYPLYSYGSEPNHYSTLAVISDMAAPLTSILSRPHSINASTRAWLSRHHYLRDWVTKSEGSLLQIYGKSSIELSDVTNCLSHLVEDQSGRVLRFEFESRDDRCNSLEAMLCTFLTQIFSHIEPEWLDISDLHNRLSSSQKVCAQDLWHILSTLWSIPDLIDQLPNVYLICRPDRCSFHNVDADLGWLLDRLSQLTYESERALKFVVSSTRRLDGRTLAYSTNILTIDLETDKSTRNTTTVPHTALKSRVESEIHSTDRVLQSLVLGLSSPEERSGVEKFLLQSESAKESTQLVQDWIMCQEIVRPCPFIFTGQSTKLREDTDINKYSVLKNILDSLPIRLHPAGRLAMAMISECLGPLSGSELDDFLSASLPESVHFHERTYYPGAEGIMKQIFCHLQPCLLNVDETIHLKYEELRSIIFDSSTKGTKTDPKWYTFETESEVHGIIARALLVFLSTESALVDMSSALHRRVQHRHKSMVIHNSGIMAYAVLKWPVHYRLANGIHLLDDARRFFDSNSQNNWREWARLHHLLLNSITRSEEPPATPLIASCSLGLDDVAQSYLESHRNSTATAAIEAARHGHSSLVKFLVEHMKEEPYPIRDILNAAISSSNHECISDLIRTFSQNIQDDILLCPSSLLPRSAGLGYTDVVRQLIELGVPIEPDSSETSMMMTPLQHAVANGHFDTVTTLIAHHVPVDGIIPGESETTPLSLACKFGYTRIIDCLLEGEADPNGIGDGHRDPPLVAASSSGRYEVINSLCKAGASFDRAYLDNEVYLRSIDICIKSGFSYSLKSILSAQANVDLDRFNMKRLDKVFKRNHLAVIRVLLEAGARLDPEGFFNTAVALDDTGIVDLLITHEESNCDGGETVPWKKKYELEMSEALIAAIRKGSLRMVRYLLGRGADANKQSPDGRTPLYMAARNGMAEIVQALLSSGASIDSPYNEWTPLQIAYDSAPVVRTLLGNKVKPDIDRVEPIGSVLYLAAKWNYVDVVRALVEHLPPPNLNLPAPNDEDYRGLSALSAAVLRGNTDVVQILLDAGADVNHVSDNRNCPLHFAVWSLVPSANDACLRLLLRSHPDLDQADAQGDVALTCFRSTTPALSVELLLRAGADPELANDSGGTPLLWAVDTGNIDVARCLLEYQRGSTRGVRPNRANFNGETPLHLACRKRNLDFVRLLVEHGANVNFVASEAVGTPLQAVCERRSDEDDGQQEQEQRQWQHKIITYLLLPENGANVNKMSGVFGSALGSACVFAADDIVRLLYANGARPYGYYDELERNPAQLASLRTLDHATIFFESSTLFKIRDVLGRNALHYAVGSGRLDLVERVFELSGQKADVLDNDRWTPLMWATRLSYRGFGGDKNGVELEPIVRFLLSRGADIWVRDLGSDGEREGTDVWSPLKLARYHGCSDAILKLLTPRACANDGCDTAATGLEDLYCQHHALKTENAKDDDTASSGEPLGTIERVRLLSDWDENFHATRQGRRRIDSFCNSCLYELCGAYSYCPSCDQFQLCFKCSRNSSKLHPGHVFQNNVGEFERRSNDTMSDYDSEYDEFDEDEFYGHDDDIVVSGWGSARSSRSQRSAADEPSASVLEQQGISETRRFVR